jgi:uncharacterized protein with PQ loop repeat
LYLAVFGWVLAACTVFPELVQLRRSSKVRSSEGIAPLTQVATLVVFAWWLCYSARLQVWQGAATDIIALSLAAWHARITKVLSWSHVAFVCVLAACGAFLPITVLGVLATAISASRGVPQLRAAWKAADLSGVSSSYWLLQALTGIGWLVFGVQSGAPWLGAFAVVAAPVSLAIAWHARQGRTSSARTALAAY